MNTTRPEPVAQTPRAGRELRGKRIFDVVVTLLLILVLLPLMASIALLVRLSSPGPIIFRQRRLGRDGVPFEILKFRTMIDGAEEVGSGIFTFKGDPRVTKVGRLLRKTSLDELPQLFNVICGEMSIVGPRPPLVAHPKVLADYTDEELVRFYVPPGITGYAQVFGRNSLSWEERFQFDRHYVMNWSLLLDLKIIVRTVSQVVLGRNVTVRVKE